ncbi:hypothetical protein [Motiliproteus sediminis]|uniref:hypothetical protein n=1 Tax=Motiliproteus sediminis TaxID=1468178 RepID=UPI001AEF9456|nr:hypothetical protein [Motiliproteus sediminis]
MQIFISPTATASPSAAIVEGGWYALALAALALGSVMAVVLVLAKTPWLATALGLDQFFPVALVYHVNLTILLWVNAVAALLWRQAFVCRWPLLDGLGLWLAAVGAVTLLFPLGGAPTAVLSNYVPVIDSHWFVGGLAAFMAGVTLHLINRLPALIAGLVSLRRDGEWLLALAGFAWLMAIVVLLITGWQLQPLQHWTQQAELLFWGGGHVIQAVNLLLLLAVAMRLAGARVSEFTARLLQSFMLAALVAALAIALAYDPASAEYRQLFTGWMRFFSIPLLLLLFWPLWSAHTGRERRESIALQGALVLLLLGALVGAAIRGDNLLVPAHYHAMTGALNLMLMVFLYRHYGNLSASGSHCRQLRLYLLGVVMMVIGLALSGWLGVGRKLAGDAQGLAGVAEHAAWGLMGVGGALALMGCFMFLSAQLRAAWLQRRNGHELPLEVN